MYCPKCGFQINPDDKFCRACGESLIRTDDSNPVQNNDLSSNDKKGKSSLHCTNCGTSVGKLKLCPKCRLKTKKNYKMHCMYCGGTIGNNNKCNTCGSLARTSLIEIIARFIISIALIFNYLFAIGCILVNKMLIEGITVLIGTFAVHIFLYRKRQIKKIKIKLFHVKARKIIFSLIYMGIFLSMFLIMAVGTSLGNSTISDYADNSRAISYSENIIKQTLKNPSSMQINDSKVAESFVSDDGWTYYKVIIDYSAQNGFGGYNRKQEEIYVRSFEYSNTIEQISASEYILTKISK